MGSVIHIVEADGAPADGLQALIKAILSTHGCTKVSLTFVGRGSGVGMPTAALQQQQLGITAVYAAWPAIFVPKMGKQ
jgi:hypothetical protein